MHVFCRQTEALSPRSWRVVISGDGQERTIVLQVSFKLEAEERLVKWYIEDFVNSPFSKYRARAAAAELRGLWTDIIPHPSQIMDIFEGDYLPLRIQIIQYIVNIIPKSQLESSLLLFELWSIMREIPVTRKEAQSSSNSLPLASKITINSLQNAVRLLMAANLITRRTETLVDGMKGYQYTPLLHSGFVESCWCYRIIRFP